MASGFARGWREGFLTLYALGQCHQSPPSEKPSKALSSPFLVGTGVAYNEA